MCSLPRGTELLLEEGKKYPLLRCRNVYMLPGRRGASFTRADGDGRCTTIHAAATCTCRTDGDERTEDDEGGGGRKSGEGRRASGGREVNRFQQIKQSMQCAGRQFYAKQVR